MIKDPNKTVVLLVEDDDDIAALIEHMLYRGTVDVVKARSLSQARAAIERVVPDVIVLDRMLPDGDGMELCVELKKGESTRRIPILFLTGRAEYEDRLDVLKAGGDDYIAKPFDPRELLLRMGALLKR